MGIEKCLPFTKRQSGKGGTVPLGRSMELYQERAERLTHLLWMSVDREELES